MTAPTIAIYDADADEWTVREMTAEEIEQNRDLPDPSIITEPSTEVSLPLLPTLPPVADPIQ